MHSVGFLPSVLLQAYLARADWLKQFEVGLVAEWQTRMLEGHVPARACWFDSSRAHSDSYKRRRCKKLFATPSFMIELYVAARIRI